MSIWTIFAICFTTLLLITGTAFTLLVFYRADKRMKEAELLRGGESLTGAWRSTSNRRASRSST